MSVAPTDAGPPPILDAFLAKCYYAWDHAPWILLVAEAGARFTDPTGGHASDRGGGLYSNAVLHEQLLTSLHNPRPSDLDQGVGTGAGGSVEGVGVW